MPTDGQEVPPPMDISIDNPIRTVKFSANGAYLVSGDKDKVRVWRVKDSKRMATMDAGTVVCLAVSSDGRRIAAGTASGDVFVWDTKRYKQVFACKASRAINGLDFSPDATRLAVASVDGTATVWSVAARKRALGPLPHDGWVVAVKYAPHGDRIATATFDAVRVYDGDDGRLLLDVKLKVVPWRNTGLLWSGEHLFVVSDGKIVRLDSSTGSAVAEWPVPDGDHLSSIVLPQDATFLAYSTRRTTTFWDTSEKRTQLGIVQHAQDVRSVALAPDDRLLAIGGEDGKIAVKNLGDVFLSFHSTIPFIDVSDAALDSWKQDRFIDAEVSLTTTIFNSGSPSHSALANRALVRAHMGQWDLAVEDAEKSINVRPSVIGYVAKSIALIAGGKREGSRIYDLAFKHCDPIHVDLLLLVKAIATFLARKHDEAISRVGDLIATSPLGSMCRVVQAHMYLLRGNAYMKNRNYEGAIQAFERATYARVQHDMEPHLLVITLISGWKFDDLDVTIRQRLSEAIYGAAHAKDANKPLPSLKKSFDKGAHTTGPAGLAPKSGLDPSTPTPRVKEWARSTLATSSWKHALITATKLMVPRFTIYRAICEHLETIGRITDAVQCFRQMLDELAEQVNVNEKQAQWVLDFKRRCSGKLEDLGDASMSAARHDDAISHYSVALLLDLATPQEFFLKRSKAYLAKGLWESALDDANKVIMLDSASPWGYERKHAALHEAGDYENAMDAFEAMITKMSQSPDPVLRERRRRYVNPRETKETIRRAVQDAVRESPRVLINTLSGRLLDKSGQTAAFESLPAFKKLVSSMTTEIDHARIERDVAEYFRYAMFSHKWEDNEPLFSKVIHIVVYDLEASLTHDKLRTFCKIVRDAGLHWAWCDTCCIDKADHFVLQEALVSMFKWYRGSAVTIVLLRGVRSPSQRGDLVKSIWNTRAWTFQEYHASKVVRFYNEDWTLYRNLDVPNHKESPEIISEMEEATGLCLASRRETTFVEDAAYSLLGIFSVSLPVVYGEGDKALGRLLAQLLTSSGDTSILAWSGGQSSSFNSCLPASITAFRRLPTAHIPLTIEPAEMDKITAFHTSRGNLTSVTKFYNKLSGLPVASFAGQRMKLPCIIFELGFATSSLHHSIYVFRSEGGELEIVKIRTGENLGRFQSLYLIHPWVDFLLDRHPVGSIAEVTSQENTGTLGDSSLPSGSTNVTSEATSRLVARLGTRLDAWLATRRRAPSLPASQAERQTQALRLVARLERPFDALLVTPTRRNVAEYRRVAVDSTITARVREGVSLEMLVENVRVLDVL